MNIAPLWTNDFQNSDIFHKKNYFKNEVCKISSRSSWINGKLYADFVVAMHNQAVIPLHLSFIDIQDSPPEAHGIDYSHTVLWLKIS